MVHAELPVLRSTVLVAVSLTLMGLLLIEIDAQKMANIWPRLVC